VWNLMRAAISLLQYPMSCRVLTGQIPSGRPHILRNVPCLIFLLVAASFPMCLTGQKPTANAHNILEEFSREAAASDPAGIVKYSQDLIELLVPEESGGDYIRSLAGRLASAEQKARQGSGNLISEAAVTGSFNTLMKEINGSPSWRADEASLHAFRQRSTSIQSLSPLFSAGRNGGNCNPAEAVMLLYLLIYNDGRLSGHMLDSFDGQRSASVPTQPASELTGGSVTPNQRARELLALYSVKHDRRAIIKSFNHAVQILGF
jgi:hypothetical protein